MKNAEKKYSLDDLAKLVAGKVVGDGATLIQGLSGLELAEPGDISFVVDRKKLKELGDCRASALIVPLGSDVAEDVQVPLLLVEDPNLASAIIHNYLLDEPFLAKGVHPTAHIGEGCRISELVTIGAGVVVGDRVVIGDQVSIGPGSVVEDDVRIGNDTVLHANVTVRNTCTIGQRVLIHPGAVIGSDGFGFATDRRTGRHVKKPQVGTVEIGNDVEIGANSCIDRAAFGKTVIQDGVMIDNLVQVAHNVEIGENSVLVAQVGIAGSVCLGRNVVLGGQAGLAGHIRLGDGVMAAAQSGIHNNQKNGVVLGGSPAIDIKKFSRASVAFSRLPEMRSELKRLKKEIKKLANALQHKQQSENKREE